MSNVKKKIKNKHCYYILPVLLLTGLGVLAQDRFSGTAIVQVGSSEYMIPIECNDATRPELGLSTEPSRITREATGRASGIRLNVRPWKDTTDLVVSLDRYVAWVAVKPSIGGVLTMTLDMSPASSLKDGVPTALTYDMWMDGDRPAGLEDVSLKADCSRRDPAAPAFRKLPEIAQ